MIDVRINVADYERFVSNFYHKKTYPNQRLGQAFCNAFGITNPALFYEMDNREAIDLIESFIVNDDSNHCFQEPYIPPRHPK